MNSELSGETDADLMVYMSMAADDAEIARAAWDEFYQRHVGYLYAVCLRAYSELVGGPPGVADLVAETFRVVYEAAENFDPSRAPDREGARRVVRAWLGSVARRLVQSMLRGRRQLPERTLSQDAWQNIAAHEPATPRKSPETETVREALLTLAKREQIVIRTTFQWYEPGRKHQRLPNEIVDELAKTLRTTPENLRQIRRRSMKKLERYLRAHASNCAAGEEHSHG